MAYAPPNPSAAADAGLTVGEVLVLRLVCPRYRPGEPFRITDEAKRGSAAIIGWLQRVGESGLAGICDGLSAKGLMIRERGRSRYSITVDGETAWKAMMGQSNAIMARSLSRAGGTSAWLGKRG